MASLALNTPSKQSIAGAWIQWHKDLVSELGKADANSIFMKYWSVRGSETANTHELRDYMNTQGVKIETGLAGSIFDTGADVVGGVGNFFKMGKYAAIGLGIIVVVPLALLLFNIARNPVGAMGAAAKLKG
jgi:hypothetical protein